MFLLKSLVFGEYLCYDASIHANIAKNAENETLALESNRNAASPTESAACGRLLREHSGAGCLKGFSRAIREHALSVRESSKVC